MVDGHEPSSTSSSYSMSNRGSNHGSADGSERGRSPISHHMDLLRSSSRTPTSAEIDAVIAAAMANAPPPIPIQPEFTESINRSVTPLMTNLLPSAVGIDGRVNLFVGNLPYRVRWQDLKDLFRKAGTVLRADVSLGPDNRSRGYGTVLMGSREDAARAIDRYNGYTWQTRTLEVRPDRLPPEYEPQNHILQQQPHPHSNQHPHRPPVFAYHSSGHAPFPMSGHLTSQPNWMPGHGGRPSFPGGPGHTGSHPFLLPGSTLSSLGTHSSPLAPPMTLSGSSPIPTSQTPSASLYPAVSLPISAQNTGGHPLPYPQLAASPLAGSLTAGTPQPHPQTGIHSRRESQAPFSHSISPDPHIPQPHPKSTSPAPDIAVGASRPSTGHDKPTPPPSSISLVRGDSSSGRAPPPGNLGALPPPPFGAVKAVISPTSSSQGLAPSGPSASTDEIGQSPSAIPRVPVAPIPQLEGLAHQGMGLGPPGTLHDRVIFVSNLPLSVQWQDLKDLLRPAGTIIRADIATDASGKPRGFGTALFASEGDAAKAVSMLNDREIQGQRIRAHLERDGTASRRGSTVADFAQTPPQVDGTSDDSTKPDESAFADGSAVSSAPAGSTVSPQKSGEVSPAAKLPWSLNTSLQQQTPGRPRPIQGQGPTHGTPGLHQHTPNLRQLHHPGPISMPSFPPMQQENPLSPLQSRGLPPMTPSMPGFVFNAPMYPETPGGFMSSSNFGPFSPGIPVTSPNAFGYNPFSAPGAPIRYPQPPHSQIHQYQGSAALGTPTTQSFPIMNGHSNHNGYNGGPPGSISQALLNNNQDYFPSMGNVVSAPDTPTPKINDNKRPSTSSNSSSTVTTNPLNARERLASTASGSGSIIENLIESTDQLEILQDDEDDETRAPDSPSEMRRSLSNNSNKHLQQNNHDVRGRGSLDERRSFLDPSVSSSVDRRASFDVAKR
ncbi:uncharacterized protein L201_000561 [Kwoniella dendrophila CBS 6074]|uniref:RRM domain-containing protein n=1 Tax=Kwoniella dendrophila CBS 6074 TaxID=1295534 RepID=A0AAX4JME5_9TREE